MLWAILTLFVVFLAYAYFRVALWVWIPSVAAGLLLMTFSGAFSFWTGFWVWFDFIAIVVVYGVPFVRRQLISAPLFHYFAKILPPISETEQEAIEAGDVWWEGELFSGKPNWSKLFEGSLPSLSEREQAFLDNQVETLCEMIDDWQCVGRDRDLSPDVWSYFANICF